MMLRPSTLEQLRAELARANSAGEQGLVFNLETLNRVLEYAPEDMTVTVEAGVTLAALQARLAQHGQWLPIDPPAPGPSSIADIVNSDASGPRRFGYGTIREHLLGIKVAMADGRLIHSGGKVVKNVAGYDLCKLFVGSRGSLGVLVEATFKVRPLPEAERFVAARCESLDQTAALLEAVRGSPLAPVVLDLERVGTRQNSGTAVPAVPAGVPPALAFAGQTPAPTDETPVPLIGHPAACSLILGLAGTREAVDWQLNKAAELGLSAPASLDYENGFWSAIQGGLVHHISVLPSRLTETLQGLGATQFVTRAGNGVIYYRGGMAPPKADLPRALMQRIKDTYDPKHTLPDFPGVAG